MKIQLNDSKAGERLRKGIHIAIVGAPNVGKSTLLNTLIQRPAAIVSPLAGTTRFGYSLSEIQCLLISA